MTNRKCGTCRFYEAGTQQSHGWCRNPAYPRRDEVALLRPEELGCRSGWDKDYWAAQGSESAAPVSLSSLAADQVVVVPLLPDAPSTLLPIAPAASAAEPAPDSVAAPLAPPARRRNVQGPPVVPVSAPPVMAGKETTINFDSSLTGHPELGENGVPIRSTRRSAVAEAHRRALERREQERAAVADRERVPTPERAPTPERRPQPAPIPAPPPTPSPSPLGISARPSLPAQPTSTFTLDLPSREGLHLPPRESLRPAVTLTSASVELPPAPPAPEAVDLIISTGESPKQELPRETVSAPRFVPGVPAPVPPAALPEAEPVRPAVVAPVAETPASADPATAPRYWHQSLETSRFTRMRDAVAPTPPARVEPRPVQPVGRPRPEPPAPADGLTGRTIRQLQSPGTVNEAARVEEPAEMPRPPRLTPPPTEARTALPQLPSQPEVAPRQIDDALLRQLETDWRSRALEAHTGQRCSTCRFFQPSEGGRGSCGCAFTAVYRHPVDPQELGCLNALGTWWAATDDGWLERTERRPRRATPLLDALLREHEAEEAARESTERRRSAR